MDVYLCASSLEGTPNTILEAMASGACVVATRVGVVPELFGPLQQQFIVDRSVDAFVEALRRLCADAGLRKELAQENLDQIKKHTWKRYAPSWQQFFSAVVRNAHVNSPNWRRFMIEKVFLAADKPELPNS